MPLLVKMDRLFFRNNNTYKSAYVDLLSMNKLFFKINYEKINYFAFLLLAFSLNFPQRIVIYTLAFWLITCLPVLQFRNHQIAKNIANVSMLILVSLFLGRIAIAIYHHDLLELTTGLLIDTQLALFLLPFVLLLQVNKLIDPNKVLFIYLAGCLVSSVVAVIFFYLFRFGVLNPYAHLLYIPLRDANSSIADDVILFQGSITWFFKHRAAMGANLVMGIACLIYLMKKTGNVKLWRWVGACLVGVFLAGVIYVTGSRSGLISLFSILAISVIYLFISNRKRLVIAFLLIIVLFSAFLSLKTTRSLLTSEISTLNYSKLRTADPRFRIWESSVEIIKENPIAGVGYSEVYPRLFEKYNRMGVLEFIKERFNSHNQFLQFSLESGVWAGLLYAVFLLTLYLWKEKRYLSFCFTTVFFIYSMFEDAVIIFNGVSLLVFFIAILYISEKNKEITD